MKKILVIFTQPIENNTSSMIRCRNIINIFPEIGCKVVCYAPAPDANSMYYDERIKIADTITVRRYGGGSLQIKNTLKEAGLVKKKILTGIYSVYKKIDLFGSSIRYIKYKDSISREVSNEKYDMILSFSDPKSAHILAGVCKKKKKNLFYVQQWGDPLAEDITSKTLIPKWIRHFIEARLLKEADRVFYVSPITCQIQKMQFKKYAEKMQFIPTPCEKKSYLDCKNTKIAIGYLGSYNLIARDIRPFYNAACECKECDFLIVGDSDLQLENTDNVRIVQRVSQKELENYIESLDILVCLLNSRGTQIPGKIYNYAGTNKEILVIEDGEYGAQIREFFEQYNRYTFVRNSKEAIKKVLKAYVKNGIPARQCIEAFDAKHIAAKLIEN